jgi:hypothetical protein
LFIIVVMKGRATEIDARIANGLRRVVIVMLVGDAITKFGNISIGELMGRPVLYGECEILELLHVLR